MRSPNLAVQRLCCMDTAADRNHDQPSRMEPRAFGPDVTGAERRMNMRFSRLEATPARRSAARRRGVCCTIRGTAISVDFGRFRRGGRLMTVVMVSHHTAIRAPKLISSLLLL